MPKSAYFTFTLLCVVATSCWPGTSFADASVAPISQSTYALEHAEWRRDRMQFLKSPTGYLNLVGLHWLRDGQYSFGSASDNRLVFPDRAATKVGMLEVGDGAVHMTVEPGVSVLVDGQAIPAIEMSDDASEQPVIARHRAIAWTVIRRNDRVALRVRDFENPALTGFVEPDYFPLDTMFLRPARFSPYAAPRVVNVDTVIEGLEYKPESPGTLQFDIGNESFELEAYAVGDQLFIIFGDRTSGRETYPAGRFLYAEWPSEDGITILDFNKAYNPPCAFNEFATCPIASPRNRLKTPILAGERFDPAIHNTH